MSKARLMFGMPVEAVIAEICDQNLRAVRICLEFFSDHSKVDPDASKNPYFIFGGFDRMQIYGDEIVDLFEACDNNVGKLIAVMRASQLGMIKKHEIKKAIKEHTKLDIDLLIKQIQERLPKFNASA